MGLLDLFREINRDAAIEMSYKPRSSYLARCKELGIKPPKVFYDPKIRSLHPWIARRPRSIARLSILLALADEIPTKELLDIFRIEEIRKKVRQGYPPLLSYTKPKLLSKKIILCDPMAGGGSIPLESVLLGIKTIAFDYNPVAYLILKGCIEYPLKFKEELSEAVKKEARKLIEFSQNALGKFYDEKDDAYIFTKGVICPSCAKKMNLSTLEIDAKGKVGKIVKKAANQLKVRCYSCWSLFNVDKRRLLRVWVNDHKRLTSLLLSGETDEHLLLKVHSLLTIKDVYGKYIEISKKDQSLLIQAAKFLAENIDSLKSFIPMNQIHYQNKVFSPLFKYGIKYWYEIFNPRQLLALATLTKYIRERCEELISKNGEFGAAVSLYLSFGLSKMVDFNTLLTTWNVTNKSIRDTVGQYARSRKIELNLEYCEAVVPYKNLRWVFEPDATERTGGGICPVLEELCKQMEGVNSEVKIYQFDAKKLSALGRGFVDIVNVDPPYFDQHIYSDFSEFFWIVLRNCLKEVIGSYLFNEEINGRKSWDYLDWNPSLAYVPRKDELIVRKGKNYVGEVERYKRNLMEFFKSTYKALKEDGKLVLWFTHKSWRAWESVIYSLYLSDFKVIRFYPFVSEHPTRSVTLSGEPRLNRTIIIIATKHFNEGIKDLEEDVFRFCSEVYDYLVNAKITPRERIQLWEKLLTLMAASTARLTILGSGNKEMMFKNRVLPQGVGLGIVSLLRILSKEKLGRDAKDLIRNLGKIDKAVLLLQVLQKLLGEVRISLAEYICKFCGISLYDLRREKIVTVNRKSVKILRVTKKVSDILRAVFG